MTTSIYEFIKASIDENGRIPYASEKLPDNDSFFSGLSFGFVGGAFEGIMPSGKVTEKSELRKAEKILRAVQRFADNPSARTRKAMCKVLKERHSTSYLQPVIEGLSLPNNKLTAFYGGVKEMVLSSPNRNIVKYSLYFMCIGPIEQDKKIVITLAKHDEFTLHAIRAVLLGFKEPNEVIFDIARCVDGWGKISAVEYLEPVTDEIQGWLLRHGCTNSIMDNYLAMICAEKGNLLEAIKAPQIDSELFAGAGVILKALIEDIGPAESVEDYQDGAEVIRHYLGHAVSMCNSIEDLLVVLAIKELLGRDTILSEKMLTKGWTSAIVDACIPVCKGILDEPQWPELVWEHVKSSDRVKNFHGRAAARRLGIDIWNYTFDRLQSIPEEDPHYEKDACYYELADTAAPVRFQKLVDYAEKALLLDKIACGPGTDMGMGLAYKDHACLDTMLQNLRNRPGVGIKLIEAGLWSSVIRNRSLALSALETWNEKSFSAVIVSRLEFLKKCEPDREVKKRVLALLKTSS